MFSNDVVMKTALSLVVVISIKLYMQKLDDNASSRNDVSAQSDMVNQSVCACGSISENMN